MSQHIAESDPRAAAHPFFHGENIFPDGIPSHLLREPVERYYEAVLALAVKLLQMLARGLPYGDDVFDEFASNDPICVVRLLHYPPQRDLDNERQLGAGAHTDFG